MRSIEDLTDKSSDCRRIDQNRHIRLKKALKPMFLVVPTELLGEPSGNP
jgi:hypothetical protein